MAAQSLGKITITTAGTPERATKGQSDPGKRIGAHAIMVQAWPGNTGKVWVGLVGLNKTTGANVIVILPIPTTNILPSYNAVISQAAAAFDLRDIYLDVDVSGEAALVTYLEG